MNAKRDPVQQDWQDSVTPKDAFPRLARKFDELERLCQAHMDRAERVIKAGHTYSSDEVVLPIVKRSLDLVAAIHLLMQDWNYTAAAALLRLQLDNLARLHYLAKLDDRSEFVLALLNGTPLHKLQDKQGKRLTDKRLCELATTDYPWLPRVYEETSKFVHFSPKHVVQTIRSVDEPNRTVTTVICRGAPDCPESSIEELLDATVEVTRSVLNAVDGWIVWKTENEELLGPDFDARMQRGDFQADSLR